MRSSTEKHAARHSVGFSIKTVFEYVIPVIISLKVAAYIFYNYEFLSKLLNLGSAFFALCGLFFLTTKGAVKFTASRLKLTISLIAASLIHAIFTIDNPDIYLTFLLSALIALPFFIHIELASSVALNRVLYLSGLWMLLKIFIYSIPFCLIWIAGFPFDDPIVQLLLGENVRGAPLEGLGGLVRIMDKSLVLFPLIIYVLRSAPRVFNWIAWVVCIFVFTVNFTAAIFVSGIVVLMLYLLLQRAKFTFFFFALFMFLGGAFLINTDAWEILREDKMISTSIKAQQFENTIDAFDEKPFGNGIGHLDSRLFRSGDMIFENSYLFVLYSYGVFALIPFFYLAIFFIKSTRIASSVKGYFPAAATAISIIISSGSNPYLFAGTIYVLLYAISRIYQDYFQQK